MRVLITVLLIIVVIVFGYFRLISHKGGIDQQRSNASQVNSHNRSNSEVSTLTQESLFVPYWQLPLGDDIFSSFRTQAPKRVIYFGVSTSKEGINRDDDGYIALERSWKRTDTYQTILTLRMLDADVNEYVLKHPEAQNELIVDALETAKKYGFKGIALDQEVVSVFDTGTKRAISSFVERFYSRAQDENLTFSIILYGDVYYRKRPYDLRFLSQHADEVMLMAYDFHKSRGEPGPNFPLEGRERYGYDYHQLVDDVSKDVVPGKITVIYGLYGYDWIVDEAKRPFRAATSMTYAQIQNNYIAKCKILNCVVQRDKKSYENEIDFVDREAQYHIVWYEDWISVDKKTDYLMKNGVSSIAYWAYGYF